MKDVYIHYGSNKFRREYFETIKNREFSNKPSGGLWASKENDDYGWDVWCRLNEFRDCKKENSFRFKLKEGSRCLKLITPLDIVRAPKLDKGEKRELFLSDWVYLDFEKICKDYDYIEFEENEYSHIALYGWDCNCILVLNADVVEEL